MSLFSAYVLDHKSHVLGTLKLHLKTVNDETKYKPILNGKGFLIT